MKLSYSHIIKNMNILHYFLFNKNINLNLNSKKIITNIIVFIKLVEGIDFYLACNKNYFPII